MARNSVIVPEAKEAMKNFKMQAASEVGVNLKDGYNGELTSRQAGSVGGQMVKNVFPVRLFERVLILRMVFSTLLPVNILISKFI